MRFSARVLADMLTTKDIQKLKVLFASKQDLRQEIEGLETRFDKKFDKVINKLDAVYGEVKDMRQEQKFHLGQHNRINEQLEKLEAKVFP